MSESQWLYLQGGHVSYKINGVGANFGLPYGTEEATRTETKYFYKPS
jgi:hypothetical protein